MPKYRLNVIIEMEEDNDNYAKRKALNMIDKIDVIIGELGLERNVRLTEVVHVADSPNIIPRRIKL
jgi:hypothetical protein